MDEFMLILPAVVLGIGRKAEKLFTSILSDCLLLIVHFYRWYMYAAISLI